MSIIWGIIGIIGAILAIGGAIICFIIAVVKLREWMKLEDKNGKC